ncbi:MAG: hypothetical protein FWD57_11195 [Polyangiaceae bacterium]|nr:hypothetical protein [Polyangiaceae bacterium]
MKKLVFVGIISAFAIAAYACSSDDDDNGGGSNTGGGGGEDADAPEETGDDEGLGGGGEGGSGNGGDGGDGTGATGGEPPGGNDYANCNQCIEGECIAQYMTCDGNEHCFAILECMDNCGPNGACQQACPDQHPAGKSDFMQLYNCMYGNCLDECFVPG